jgi:hypothetical protein
MNNSENTWMNVSADGKYLFGEKKNPNVVLLELEHNASSCCCTFWRAYEIQCPHLLLLHRGFGLSLCASRWHQLSHLETSLGAKGIGL